MKTTNSTNKIKKPVAKGVAKVPVVMHSNAAPQALQ